MPITDHMDSLPSVDAPGVHYSPKTGKKTFIPLENNPEAFTHLATQLGLTPNLSFYDVFSLDPSGSSHIPRPVQALILICPSPIYRLARSAEYEAQSQYTGSGPDEPVLWIRQTIGHACGLMSLLHAVLNLNEPFSKSGVKHDAILPSTPLGRFRNTVISLDPEARARYLYHDKDIERLHMAAAHIGDSIVPSAADDNFNHFITFAKGKDGHLWELNGGMKGPVDRGALEGDVLSQDGLEKGINEFLGKAGGEELGFSVVALAPREN